jgi:hypothetical protein
MGIYDLVVVVCGAPLLGREVQRTDDAMLKLQTVLAWVGISFKKGEITRR